MLARAGATFVRAAGAAAASSTGRCFARGALRAAAAARGLWRAAPRKCPLARARARAPLLPTERQHPALRAAPTPPPPPPAPHPTQISPRRPTLPAPPSRALPAPAAFAAKGGEQGFIPGIEGLAGRARAEAMVKKVYGEELYDREANAYFEEGTRENPIPILSTEDERIVGVSLPDDAEVRWMILRKNELLYDPDTCNYFALKQVRARARAQPAAAAAGCPRARPRLARAARPSCSPASLLTKPRSLPPHPRPACR